MSASFRKSVIAAAFLGACGGPKPVTPTEAFIEIPRPFRSAERDAAKKKMDSAVGTQEDHTFYLGIRKTALDTRWFLSAYLKQYFPGAVSAGAARSLGTRVVTFKRQNGMLFVFAADNLRKTSDTFDPESIIEAYPILDDVDGIGDDYIAFDPAAGLNRFGVVSDAFAGGAGAVRFEVELSFMSHFRKLADGVTYEQVFTGYAENG